MPGFSFSDPSVWEAAENFQNDAPLERTYAPPRKERMSELELFNQLNNFKSAKPKKAQNKKQEGQNKKQDGLNKNQESLNKKQDVTSKKQESQSKKQDVPPSKPKQSQSKNCENRPKDSNPVQQKTGNQKQPQP